MLEIKLFIHSTAELEALEQALELFTDTERERLAEPTPEGTHPERARDLARQIGACRLLERIRGGK